MKVSDYLPNFYKNNLEINNIINTEETEFEDTLKPAIENSFKDQSANTATVTGIANFESMLGIKPSSTDSIDFRRKVVLNRLISHTPFTLVYLRNKLDEIMGAGNWSYTIDYDKLTLEIKGVTPGKGWYIELNDMMDKTIPCNISWSISVFQATWGAVKDKFTTWNDISSKTWQEVLDGEWTNS